MRPTLIRLAKTLEPGTPTGLTGLLTHPAPRSALVYLYSSTLKKLQKVPEYSPYRQATEALTRKRLNIVEAVKPAGYDAWVERVQVAVAKHRERWPLKEGEQERTEEWEDRQFLFAQVASAEERAEDSEGSRFEGEFDPVQTDEGQRTQAERDEDLKSLTEADIGAAHARPKIEPEPLLTRDQVSELEQQLGAGLIEEVIQVAESENRLVDIMIENEVWSDLCEQPPEGQWSYFERGTHTST